MDVNRARVERAAAALCEAEAKRVALPGLPADARPANALEAYAIQDRFAAQLGTPAGYKIAYTNPAVRERLGIPAPMFGRLLRERIFASPARLAPARFFHLLVETEFGFQMARALPQRPAEYTRAELEAAIGAVIPSIELADTRLGDWRKVAPLDAAADNALGSHWVSGTPRSDFRDFDLAAHEVVTAVNGRVASRGRGANVLGSPLLALLWLANELRRLGRGLAAGDLVTTGCCMDILELAPGDVAEADFGALGGVRVEFPVSDIMRP